MYAFHDKAKDQPTVSLNGKPVEFKLDNGYVVLNKRKKGDVIRVNLPMPVRKIQG